MCGCRLRGAERALATVAPDDFDTYYAVKDPACDLILAGAERWAARSRWAPFASDSTAHICSSS